MREYLTRFLFVAIAICFFLNVSSQGLLKTLDNGGDDYGNSVNNAGGGNFCIAGSTSMAGAGSYDAMLIKTDGAGNSLWQKQFGGSGFDAGRYAIQTSDGGYLLAGSTSSFGSNGDVLVVKTDANGNVVWSKAIGTDSVETGYRLAEGHNGYLIGGQTTGAPAPNNTNADMFLINLDYNGVVKWSKSLGSVAGTENLRDLVVTANGWAVAGSSTAGLVGGMDGVLFALDTAGVLQADFLTGGPADDEYRVIVQSGASVFVAGATRSFGVTGDDIMVAKYDLGAGIPTHVWTKSYGTVSGDESVTSAKAVPNTGYILITGQATGGGLAAEEGFMLMIDTAGAVSASKKTGAAGGDVVMDLAFGTSLAVVGYTNSFGGTQNDVLFAMPQQDGSLACSSSDLAISGTTQNDSALGPFIADYVTLDMTVTNTTAQVTTNSYTQKDSTICGTATAIADINSSMSFELFPNPANDVLNVAIYSQGNSSAQVGVFNYMGQVVKTFTAGIVPGKNNFSIDVNNLNSGVYYLRIATGSGQVVRPFVVD